MHARTVDGPVRIRCVHTSQVFAGVKLLRHVTDSLWDVGCDQLGAPDGPRRRSLGMLRLLRHRKGQPAGQHCDDYDCYG